MASWQGEQAEFSPLGAVSPCAHPKPAGTVSRKGLAAVLGCGTAAQYTLARNHVCATRYKQIFHQGLNCIPGCCQGTGQLFPLAIMQKLILRQRVLQISSLGSQQLHRVRAAWEALCSQRGKDITQDGYEVTCPPPDMCSHP